MMKKTVKGHYGYLKARKRSLLLRTFILFIGILGLVAIGWITLKTNKNWLSIIACISAIPMAMLFATYLSIARFHPATREDYERIRILCGKGVLDCDLIVANKDGKSYQLSFVYIHESGIYVYCPDPATDVNKGQEYLRNFLRIDQCDSLLLIYTNLKTFEKKLKELAPSDRDTCSEYLLKQEGVLRAISI